MGVPDSLNLLHNRIFLHDDSHDPHALIENIKNEAKAFVEQYGDRWSSEVRGSRLRQ
jgi:hypothetical protein